MAEHVRVSHEGMSELVRMTRDQYLHLSEASGAMCSGGLNNIGAFSGFLSLFKDTYAEALTAVGDGLEKAMTGAQRASANIADCRAAYAERDADIEKKMTRIRMVLECGPGTTYEGPPGEYALPGALTRAADAYGALGDVVGEAKHVKKPELAGPLTAPISATTAFLDFVNDAQDLGEATDHLDSYQEFEEQHP
jgi:hypothetical protein